MLKNLGIRTLIGQRVHNRKGDTLGRVTDVLIDGRSGRATYLAIDLGRAGAAPLTVPWSQVTVGASDVTLDIDPATLRKLVPARLH